MYLFLLKTDKDQKGRELSTPYAPPPPPNRTGLLPGKGLLSDDNPGCTSTSHLLGLDICECYMFCHRHYVIYVSGSV